MKTSCISSLLLVILFTILPSVHFAEEKTKVVVGDTIEPFMLPRYGKPGKYAALRDYAGEPRPTRPNAPRRIVVVSFFAHYCDPCKLEIPRLEKLARGWGEEVKVFLVNVGDKADEISKFLRETPTDLPILMDPYSSTATERYGIEGMPTIFVIDPNGVVHYSHTGYRPGDEMKVDKVVRKLLGGDYSISKQREEIHTRQGKVTRIQEDE